MTLRPSLILVWWPLLRLLWYLINLLAPQFLHNIEGHLCSYKLFLQKFTVHLRNLVCYTCRQRKLVFSTHQNIPAKSVGIFITYLHISFIYLDLIEEHVCKFLFPLITYVNWFKKHYRLVSIIIDTTKSYHCKFSNQNSLKRAYVFTYE